MDKYLEELEQRIVDIESELVWSDQDAAEYARTRKELERVRLVIEYRDSFNLLFQ